MNSNIYWVKEEKPLFRKSNWTIRLDNLVIGLHPDRQSAVDEAVEEAERTSVLGRQSEIWVDDDGHGFTLYKAFRPSKPSKDEEEDEEAEDDGFSEDDNIAL